MQELDSRRFLQAVALAATLAMASVATPGIARAQAAGDPGAAQTTRTDDTDDDQDWGWIGLLGLAGLLGLRRRDVHVHPTDTTTTRRP